MTRYVQSKWSKDAPVWEMENEGAGAYGGKLDGQFYLLAKSDYHEVPAPEKWEELIRFDYTGCATLWFLASTMKVERVGENWVVKRKVRP